ncbi:phage tail tube assembly chaperone [Latilactobacillus sp. 5-91]|uniref:phage tail tube assembly chaperone n=1 Tax=Latilactobacillus sp. 5-91 TaxID=3410924 RepID=UPI003C7551FB
MVKINVNKELGIKVPFDVKRSNKRVEEAYTFQLEAARFEKGVEEFNEKMQTMSKTESDKESDDDSDNQDEKMAEELLKNFEVQRDYVRKVQEYITDTLKLTKKQKETLGDMEVGETNMLAAKICAIIMGAERSDIEDDTAPEE